MIRIPTPARNHTMPDARLMVLILLMAGLTTAHGADKVTEAQAKTRLQFMTGALRRFSVQVADPADQGSNKERRTSELKAPLIRWSNPLEGAKDGIIGVFTSTGRPDVTIEFMIFQEDQIAQELTAITAADIEVNRKGQTIWKPQNRWVSFRQVDEARAAASTPARRMLQMRTIARRFRFVDHFGFEDSNIQSNELRLIPKPVYRYSDPTHGVIDGGLFVYSIGTDPEAFLLVEAVRAEDGKQHWQYACAESSIYELEAFLDGKPVWKKPRAKVFDNATSPHFAGNYPIDSKDVSLNDAVP